MTDQWWVPLIIFFAGIGFCALMVTIWIGRIDSLVNARVDARFEALLAALAEPAAEPEPGLMPPVDPWSSLHTLHDGLPDTTAPQMPEEHTWWGTRTGSLPIVPLAEPEAAEVSAEVVKGKPKSNPRKRFSEPKPPKEITVTTAVADEVRSEKVPVKAS